MAGIEIVYIYILRYLGSLLDYFVQQYQKIYIFEFSFAKTILYTSC